MNKRQRRKAAKKRLRGAPFVGLSAYLDQCNSQSDFYGRGMTDVLGDIREAVKLCMNQKPVVIAQCGGCEESVYDLTAYIVKRGKVFHGHCMRAAYDWSYAKA